MPTVNGSSPNLPIQKRLSFKLALLFLGTFLAVFFIGAVYDVFSQFREKSDAEATMASQPAPIVIDPKLQDELSKVMSYDTAPNDAAVSDPFIDHTGISNSAMANGRIVTTQASVTGNSGGTTSPAVSRIIGGTQVTTGTTAPLSPASESTRERYDAWKKNSLYQQEIPDPRIFAVEDLVPVGIVSGGRGADEVMLLSLSLCQTISYPVGTEFYDGFLSGMTRETVMFNLKNLRRTVIKSFSTASPCENKQDTQAVASAEPGKTPGY
jgi:hypothetical protein